MLSTFAHSTRISLHPDVPGYGPLDCFDEDGCDYERATLCAFDGAALAVQSKFLDCMDTKGLKGQLPAKYAPPPAQACAAAAGLAWPPIAACFAGARGDALVAAARNATLRAFGHATYGVPTVLVDGKQVCGLSAVCNFHNVAKHIPGYHSDDDAAPKDDDAPKNDDQPAAGAE